MPGPVPPSSPPAWRSPLWEGLAVLAWFALLAVAVTWPLAARLDSHLLGMRWDTEQTGAAWVSWWFRTALSHGLYPWHCPWILYPVGSPDLLARMGISLNFLVAAPLMILTGFIKGYNLMILAILCLNGIAGYLLGRQVTGDRAAGVALGSFLVASHFLHVELQVAHPDNANLAWLLLYFAAILRFLERGGRWTLAGAGLSLALATATFPGFAYLAALTAPALVVGTLARAELRLDRRYVVRTLLLAAVSAVALAPFLLIWGHASGGEGAKAGGDVVLPWLASQASLSVQERIIVDNSMRWWGTRLNEVTHVLPIGLALLAVLGLVRSFRRAVPWLLVLLLFGVLSSGPYLQLPDPHGGIALRPWPLLWAYWHLPWLDRWRFPIRFLWMGWLALTALGALGVLALIRGYTGALRLWALAGVLLLAGYDIAYEGIITVPVPTWEPPAPPRHYLDLAARGEDIAIIQVPLTIDKPSPEEERSFPVPTWAALDQYYQSTHGVRTVAGAWMSQSLQPLWLDFLHRNSLMAALMAWQSDQAGPAVDGQDLDDLWALGFREVVLNDRYLLAADRDRLDRNLTWLLGEPTFEEEGVMQVFELPPPSGEAPWARPWPLRRPPWEPAPSPLIAAFEVGDLDVVRQLAAEAPAEILTTTEQALVAIAKAEVREETVSIGLAIRAVQYEQAGYPARATALVLSAITHTPEEFEDLGYSNLADTYARRGLPALALEARRRARQQEVPEEAGLRTPAALHPIERP
ncbi:MAG: hypothetical protein ABIO70_04665 [Pseudomonadota bacterium]